MAEAVVFSLASKVLSAMASPAFKMAYDKGVSIWEAKNELAKLQVSVETIQAVLLDAERKQEGSAAVRKWIQRLKAVLYDVEDFFDEVLADDLLKQQMMDGKNKLSLKTQVRVYCSSFNPIVSRNSIAKKVKVIRGRLAEISNDMAQLGFVQGHPTDQSISMGSEKYTARCFIGEKYVIGRVEDKNVILEMLTSEPSNTVVSDGPAVISIEGIGGMGKTTLAHLIYSDKKVEKIFEENRWIACISDTTNEKEVLGKIYQSICGGSYSDLTIFQLQAKIKQLIAGKKYLLVLDDVWEDHRGKWENRKSVLSSSEKGSKIIVTTRLQSVAKAMCAVGTHNLKGLSEEDSWDLFKSLAFDSPYENDPRREIVGRELLRRCRGVPLAIWCMGSLLHNKTTQEWEEIGRVDLPIVGGEYNDEVMSILKLSYDHLPSKLKQCFTYCSLFPKDYRYNKMKLICHWIAQGYINIDEGESSYMHLLRMGFFQEVQEDEFGQMLSCKMHDIMHDLAMHLGGEEIIMMIDTSLKVSSCTRHVSLMVNGEEGELRDIPTSLLNVKLMRSCMLSGSSPNLGQVFSNLKLLRTLTLSGLGIEHIPPSIGELKLVRYLDLSRNNFGELPDSMANLVNLLVLNISSCEKFREWPHNFKKLIKLWSLVLGGCDELRLMPQGTEEMASLQHLSDFKVGKRSELDVLNVLLKQLRDHFIITFCEEMEVEGELNWQLPADASLKILKISSYPGLRIGGWGSSCTSRVEHLVLWDCKNVNYLPHLRCLPILKSLKLKGLHELEFIEEKEEEEVNSMLFFPCLKELMLEDLPKLKAWRGKLGASSFLEFSHLSELHIKDCPDLKSFPQCPNLKEFRIENGSYGSQGIKQEVSSMSLLSNTYPSLQILCIRECRGLEKLHLASPHLQSIYVQECHYLLSIELVGTPEPSLRDLTIEACSQLSSLHIDEHLIAGLDVMSIRKCRKMSLSLEKTQGKRVPKGMGCGLYLYDVDSVLAKQILSSSLVSSLQSIRIMYCRGPMSLVGVAFTSLRECRISHVHRMEILHIPSPNLQKVTLFGCEGLISAEFGVATHITIFNCRELRNLRIAHPNALKEVRITSSPSPMVADVDWDSIPNLSECSCISSIKLDGVDGVFAERLLSSPSSSSSSSTLTVPLTFLESFFICNVSGLKILSIESPLLRELTIKECSQLTNVSIVNSTSLTDLVLDDCPEFELIMGMDWDALTNLRHLTINPSPPPEKLPQCLLQRQALGHLQITDETPFPYLR